MEKNRLVLIDFQTSDIESIKETGELVESIIERFFSDCKYENDDGLLSENTIFYRGDRKVAEYTKMYDGNGRYVSFKFIVYPDYFF